MPTNHIMDEKRVNETMRVLTYDEAKKGVSAAIGVPADDWDKSFGQYVEDHKDAKLIFCWYTHRVQALFCPADQTGIWVLHVDWGIGKGKLSPREVGELQAIAKQKNLLL
jgi:hypothetical protein